MRELLAALILAGIMLGAGLDRLWAPAAAFASRELSLSGSPFPDTNPTNIQGVVQLVDTNLSRGDILLRGQRRIYCVKRGFKNALFEPSQIRFYAEKGSFSSVASDPTRHQWCAIYTAPHTAGSYDLEVWVMPNTFADLTFVRVL